MPELKGIKCIVTGKVQGVFYRASTKDKADGLNLKGWVRNLPDGSVELEAVGRPESLKKLLEWLWIGPELSKVTNVEVFNIKVNQEYSDFSIRYN